jgi:hypothetical protein
MHCSTCRQLCVSRSGSACSSTPGGSSSTHSTGRLTATNHHTAGVRRSCPAQPIPPSHCAPCRSAGVSQVQLPLLSSCSCHHRVCLSMKMQVQHSASTSHVVHKPAATAHFCMCGTHNPYAVQKRPKLPAWHAGYIVRLHSPDPGPLGVLSLYKPGTSRELLHMAYACRFDILMPWHFQDAVRATAFIQTTKACL